MTLSRRKTLALLGGGVLLAATAAGAGFVLTRRPDKALRPWEMAGQASDPRLRALSYAILAPSPHNLQPWLIDLPAPNRVLLLRDPARALPATDPHDRQITIGLGCFLKLLTVAAAEDGYALDISLYPEGESGPVAAIDFRTGGTPDPLFAHILDRRSCKEPYADTPPTPAQIAALTPFGTLVTERGRVMSLRELTWKAFQVEMRTPRVLAENVDFMRFGKAEIEASPDGIELGGPMLEAMMLAGILTREAQLDPTSRAFAEGLNIYREIMLATPAYIAMTTPGNDRAAQIEVGRRWLRLNLTTTSLGLGLHPVSQALQEYPEMAPHYRRAHELLAAPGVTVQMLGRVGVGPQVQETPRWPLESRLL